LDLSHISIFMYLKRPLRARCRNDTMKYPISTHPALTMMAKKDWMSSYAQFEGIADVLLRMSCRARQPDPLANGEQEFLADVDGYSGDFQDWLTDTKAFCQQWSEHNRAGY
jgi:acyl carrier protein phosphodiesterase